MFAVFFFSVQLSFCSLFLCHVLVYSLVLYPGHIRHWSYLWRLSPLSWHSMRLLKSFAHMCLSLASCDLFSSVSFSLMSSLKRFIVIESFFFSIVVVVVGYPHSSYHRVMSLGSGSCAMSLVPRLCSSRRITAAIRAATPTSFSRYVKAASVLQTPARSFGNAPSRIRPVETPQEHAWRQGEREISASVIIVVMFIVPLWLFVLSAESQEKKRDAVRAWALEQRAAHRPSGGESDEKV